MRRSAALFFAAACSLAAAASPAAAAEPAPAAAAAGQAAGWFAPFDDVPGQEVVLFGLVRTPANEGRVDRVLRLGAAGGLAYLAVVDPFVLGPAARGGLGAAAGVMGWTGLTGACPAYLPFGLSTRAAATGAATEGGAK